MNPGNIYIQSRLDCPMLVVLLSSDREPGIEWTEDFWRCVEFQISSAMPKLLGAQIVLYTKAELEQMERAGNLYEMSRHRPA
jgi:hypothetical protein